MKKPHSAESVCPCCERHCPSDNLHCLRGRMYFGQEADVLEHPAGGYSHAHKMPEVKDETVALMLKCGHYLHHGLIDENENILSFPSDDEKSELTKLLGNVLNNGMRKELVNNEKIKKYDIGCCSIDCSAYIKLCTRTCRR